MKPKPIAKKSREQIIEDMSLFFELEDMDPGTGYFLCNRNAVWDAIVNLAEERVRKGESKDPTGDLCSELLVFADSLLAKSPTFYPLAGIVAGYVAAERYSPQNDREIRALFAKYEDYFVRNRSIDGISSIAFATYYCAGSVLRFDSALGDFFHANTDRILHATVKTDPSSYIRLFLQAAGDAEGTYGNVMLSHNFERIMQAEDAFNRAENASEEAIIKNLAGMTSVSAYIGAGLRDGSSLEDLIIPWFSKSWDEFYSRYKLGAIRELFGYADVCNQDDSTNDKFRAAVSEKAEAHSKTQPQQMSSEPPSTSVAPDGEAARQRIGGEQPPGQPLAQPS